MYKRKLNAKYIFNIEDLEDLNMLLNYFNCIDKLC